MSSLVEAEHILKPETIDVRSLTVLLKIFDLENGARAAHIVGFPRSFLFDDTPCRDLLRPKVCLLLRG